MPNSAVELVLTDSHWEPPFIRASGHNGVDYARGKINPNDLESIAKVKDNLMKSQIASVFF